MAIQESVAVRNARADAVETAIGTAPTLELRTGAQPADCAAAASGTLIDSMALPSDWLTAASGGAKTILGSWTAGAAAAGTVGHFRIKQGATCHMQGSVTLTGGGGDITLDNTNLQTGQVATITSFTYTEGNA